MNAPRPSDDDFMDDDRDLRDLYDRLPRNEPGPGLDARIRSRAHAAAQADQRARAARRRLHPGWAIAATLVLASGLLLLTDLSQQSEPPAVDAELAQPPQLNGLAPATPPELPPELQAQQRRAAPARPAPQPFSPPADLQFAPQARAPSANREPPLDTSPPPSGATAPAAASPVEPVPRAGSARRAQVESERKLERADAPRGVAATAEQQIERVRAMLKAGRRDEAARALDALRRAWPDYRVPADLRHLLPDPARSP